MFSHFRPSAARLLTPDKGAVPDDGCIVGGVLRKKEGVAEGQSIFHHDYKGARPTCVC